MTNSGASTTRSSATPSARRKRKCPGWARFFIRAPMPASDEKSDLTESDGKDDRGPQFVIADAPTIEILDDVVRRTRRHVAWGTEVLDRLCDTDGKRERRRKHATELRELLGLSAKDLRAVHRVKKTFRGTVLS